MSTFPSAALQIRPPEQPDLLGNFAKLAQLLSMNRNTTSGRTMLTNWRSPTRPDAKAAEQEAV